MTIIHNIAARYAGKCQCKATFAAGARVTWEASTRRVIKCAWCRPIEKRAPAKKVNTLLTRFEYLSDPLGETYPQGLSGPRNPWR